MLRGIYAGASGMLAGIERVDTISDNLANAATPAFKKTRVGMRSFGRALARAQEGEQGGLPPRMATIGGLGLGTAVDATWAVFEQGSHRFTGSSLHAAIEGPGFFVVETPWGERYTRDGRFQLDDEGWLVTPDGYHLLGEGGPIRVTGNDAAIGGGGEVMSAGRVVDRLRLVSFADPGLLAREGSNLYRPEGASGAPAATSVGVATGYVEESNVNVMAEMAGLIAATRLYEANQKVILAQDDALGKAVNELGRV